MGSAAASDGSIRLRPIHYCVFVRELYRILAESPEKRSLAKGVGHDGSHVVQVRPAS